MCMWMSRGDVGIWQCQLWLRCMVDVGECWIWSDNMLEVIHEIKVFLIRLLSNSVSQLVVKGQTMRLASGHQTMRCVPLNLQVSTFGWWACVKWQGLCDLEMSPKGDSMLSGMAVLISDQWWGHSHSLTACLVCCTTGHAPIGAFQSRFFPKDSTACRCGFPMETVERGLLGYAWSVQMRSKHTHIPTNHTTHNP
jgi:hypothetical protein